MSRILNRFLFAFILICPILLPTASFAIPSEPPPLTDELPLCPNYALSKDLPPLPPIEKRSFKHYRNHLLSLFFEPHHVVFDDVMNPSDTINIAGKFSYDWLLHKALEDEVIHAYLYIGHGTLWRNLGQYQTNKNGEVTIPIKTLLAGNYLIRMVVEGDLTHVDGYLSVVHPHQEAIVFDIDGTLTMSDFELLKEFLKIAEASPYSFAKELVALYQQKKYLLVFLTARPYWMTRATRHWLHNIIASPSWVLHTKKHLFSDELKRETSKTEKYKTDYLKKLIAKGVVIKRAYGNANTDITAYENGGIPKRETYIIGPNAGKQNTQAIHKDYYEHYQTVLGSTAEAHCW